jgi:hypothetical protein
LRITRAAKAFRISVPVAVTVLVASALAGCIRPTADNTVRDAKVVLVLHHAAGGDPGASVRSKPFTAHHFVQIIGDFKGATGHEGVGGWLVPPERSSESIAALEKERSFGVAPLATDDVLTDMNGRFVVVMKYVGKRAWTITLKTGS